MLKRSICSKKQIIANLNKMSSTGRTPDGSPTSAMSTLSLGLPPHSLRGENEGEARKEKAGARDGYRIVLSSTEKPQRVQCPSVQSKEKTLIM